MARGQISGEASRTQSFTGKFKYQLERNRVLRQATSSRGFSLIKMGGAAGDEVARQAYRTKSAGDLASLGSDSCSQCGLEFMLLFVSVSLNFCVISLFIFLNLLPKFPYIRNTIPLVLRILLSY